MPLQAPLLDTTGFEQLLAEAKRRIPVHTPEWTNFAGESDPGITIVELFAFLTDSLLYRANRVPERNYIKYLQLLGIPLQPAAAAHGIATIGNERGPTAPLPLDRGVVLKAGDVGFLTRDGVTVLPVEARVFYKQRVDPSDPRYDSFKFQYEAVQLAIAAEQELNEPDPLPVNLEFYESMPMTLPSPSDPRPALDLALVGGQALYIALLAQRNVPLDVAREAIADEVISIGVAPDLADTVPPLLPARPANPRPAGPRLIYEIAAPIGNDDTPAYTRLRTVQEPDVLNELGVVQLQLPPAAQIGTWSFDDPLREGVGDFPPLIEDTQLRQRLVTWVRVRLATDNTSSGPPVARLTWVGINALRIDQAVPVVNELIGTGSGEPDQSFGLASTPVLPASLRLIVQGDDGLGYFWRLTDDLLSAGPDEPVFSLDPEAGLVRFGDGLHGARPPAGRKIVASYEYGGGPQGNVGIGAVKASTDIRLQGGYTIANPLPTWGGDLGQTADEAQRDIPLVLRHRDRLVTAQDFQDITLRTPGVDVGRVEVLPLMRPADPNSEAPGVVTVLVVPRFDNIRPRWPTPDRLFLRTVCDYLDARRLITTEIYVRGPVYKRVYVTVGIQVRAGYYTDVVRQSVTARLYEYLSALPPGGPDGTGWPLRKRLLIRDLEAVATRVPGVEFVRSILMGVESAEPVDDYGLTGLELPLLDGIDVADGEAEPLASVLPGGTTGDSSGRVVPVPVSRTKC
jgi:hypothetical protein